MVSNHGQAQLKGCILDILFGIFLLVETECILSLFLLFDYMFLYPFEYIYIYMYKYIQFCMFVPTSVHYICITCAEAPLFATRVTALVCAFKDSLDIQVGYSY